MRYILLIMQAFQKKKLYLEIQHKTQNNNVNKLDFESHKLDFESHIHFLKKVSHSHILILL